MLRKTHFDQVPLKPQRVYQEMNESLDRDTCYVTTIGLSQIAGAQFLHVYQPRNWINCGQAGPLGWTLPAALGVRAADPDRKIVALSGDYDFQFMIEELAVGAQHKLPYLHIVVNNSYLGLIRQAQRGFEMDFEVSLAFENINSAPDGDAVPGYGVDHVAVAEGLGCKAIRVKSPNEFKAAFARAKELMDEHQVPVVLEFILERVTNISMGTEVDSVNEFEDILCLDPNLSIGKKPGHADRREKAGGGSRQPTLTLKPQLRYARHGRDNYPFVLRWIDELGYKGWAGCEQEPVAATTAGLSCRRRTEPRELPQPCFHPRWRRKTWQRSVSSDSASWGARWPATLWKPVMSFSLTPAAPRRRS